MLSATPKAVSDTSRKYLEGEMPGTTGKHLQSSRDVRPSYYERRDENGRTHLVQVDPVGQRLYMQGVRIHTHAHTHTHTHTHTHAHTHTRTHAHTHARAVA